MPRRESSKWRVVSVVIWVRLTTIPKWGTIWNQTTPWKYPTVRRAWLWDRVLTWPLRDERVALDSVAHLPSPRALRKCFLGCAEHAGYFAKSQRLRPLFSVSLVFMCPLTLLCFDTAGSLNCKNSALRRKRDRSSAISYQTSQYWGKMKGNTGSVTTQTSRTPFWVITLFLCDRNLTLSTYELPEIWNHSTTVWMLLQFSFLVYVRFSKEVLDNWRELTCFWSVNSLCIRFLIFHSYPPTSWLHL